MSRALIASIAAALLATACATRTTEAPEALKPSDSESLAMTVAATGVQIYECRAAKSGSGFEWAFIAPDAQLLNSHGQVIGSHGAGPYWQAADGSRIVGTVKARADAPKSDAIPWLLLATKSVGPAGSFSKVTSVQRINTSGGVMPSGGCTAESRGAVARVPYEADYRLFVSR